MTLETDDCPLEGRRVLIVEDEYFQAREISLALSRAGAKVIGPTGRADDVPALIASGAVDAAMLDINLGGGASFDVARALRDRNIPFLFLTGYDGSVIPHDLADLPRLEKPVDQSLLANWLMQIIETGAS